MICKLCPRPFACKHFSKAGGLALHWGNSKTGWQRADARRPPAPRAVGTGNSSAPLQAKIFSTPDPRLIK